MRPKTAGTERTLILRNNLIANLKLGTIPAAEFYAYRLEQIFDGYKWDHQASGEQATISDKVVLLDDANFSFLKTKAEALHAETVAMETELLRNKSALLELGLSDRLAEGLASSNYQPTNHIRMMRFDFHPTLKGWAVSEVNSDVPAGFQEASLHPKFATRYFEGYEPVGDFAQSFLAATVTKNLSAKGTVGCIYDSHTVEDAQMFGFLGDYLKSRGYRTLHAEPNQLKWQRNRAVGADILMRHYPAEWMEFMPDIDLSSYLNAVTPSCNHPQAVIAQSKRLPLLWRKLDSPHQTWQQLLPKTIPAAGRRGYVFKPAFGRVGEGIDIPGVVSAQEAAIIAATAKNNPSQWVSQRLFDSKPINGLHLAVGVFTLDGKYASMFARTSLKPRMDFNASEIPVLKQISTYSLISRRT